MKITFKSKKDEELANSSKILSKKFGKQSHEIQKRLMQLDASPSLKCFAFDSPHTLEGDLKGCIAIDIKHPYRMIIKPIDDFLAENRETIVAIEIQTLCEDYH